MHDTRYIEIPGAGTHELPPLLVRTAVHGDVESAIEVASILGEAEEMLPELDTDSVTAERRKFELALQLTEQYRGLLSHWQWGDSILEWVRQCEITFEAVAALRELLHPDVWPHASRASFVTLLQDKHVPTPGVALERAVGLRLSFRQPPPIDCCSNQFLIYLNSTVASSAFSAWSHLGRTEAALLPPDRFHFDVVDIERMAA